MEKLAQGEIEVRCSNMPVYRGAEKYAAPSINRVERAKLRMATLATSAVAALGASGIFADRAEGKIGVDTSVEAPKADVSISPGVEASKTNIAVVPAREVSPFVIGLGQNIRVPGVNSNKANISSQPAFNLKKYCVRSGTARPRIIEAVIKHPGDKKTQSIELDAAWPAMSELCHMFRRLPFVQFQLENPDRFKTRTPKDRWLNVTSFSQPSFTEFLNPQDNDSGRKKPVRIGNEGGIGHSEFSPARPFGLIQDETKQYRCTDGKAITDGRALVRTVIKNTANKRTAGSRTFNVPLEIKTRKSPKGKFKTPREMRGAVNGPC